MLNAISSSPFYNAISQLVCPMPFLLFLTYLFLYDIIPLESEVILLKNSKIITYDLCTPGKNYDKLYEKIKSYKAWAHICESVWFISSEDSCVTIRDNLKIVIDKNDRLFVAELSGNAAWSNILCDDEYLKNNL